MKCNVGVLLIAATLTACAIGGVGGPPQNAEDLRVLVRAMPFVDPETFEVERSFGEVTSTLRKKDKECLTVKVKRDCLNCIGNSGDEIVTLKTTFVGKPERTELHIQKQGGSGGREIGAPPGGPYRAVIDAVPAGPTRTKVDLYVRSVDDRVIGNALRGWAKGTNMGCPDLTQRE